jgi:hypothetical protein
VAMAVVGMERHAKVVRLVIAARVMAGVALPTIIACLQMGVRALLGAARKLAGDA